MPIQVGAISAMARMKCYEEPFSTIANDTCSYMDLVQKEEVYNYKQRICLWIGKIKKQVLTFLIGIVTGIIGSLIVWWIQWLCK